MKDSALLMITYAELTNLLKEAQREGLDAEGCYCDLSDVREVIQESIDDGDIIPLRESPKIAFDKPVKKWKHIADTKAMLVKCTTCGEVIEMGYFDGDIKAYCPYCGQYHGENVSYE